MESGRHVDECAEQRKKSIVESQEEKQMASEAVRYAR